MDVFATLDSDTSDGSPKNEVQEGGEERPSAVGQAGYASSRSLTAVRAP